MNEIKIKMCREHWQGLAPKFKEQPTATHLLAAVEIAEKLFRENNQLEMECRQHRLNFARYEALRKLTPRQYHDLQERNMNGENFDEMVDDIALDTEKIETCENKNLESQNRSLRADSARRG